LDLLYTSSDAVLHGVLVLGASEKKTLNVIDIDSNNVCCDHY